MDEDKIKELLVVLSLPIFKAKFPENLPEDWARYEELVNLYNGLIQLRSFIKNVAEGDLHTPLKFKGFLAGTMKSLQANLLHMTWQTKMIADGDFSQRLDYLGEFSAAFNSMTEQLETLVKTVKEKEAELAAINEGLLKEVQQRKKIEAALSKSEAHYRRLTEAMKDVVLTIDLSSQQITYVSPSVTGLLGWECRELFQHKLPEIFTEKSLPDFLKIIEEKQGGHDPDEEYFCIETEMVHRDGSPVWTEIVAHIDSGEDENAHLHAVIRDITERRRLQLELKKQACTDELTGLYNRRHFTSLVKKEICRSSRCGTQAALIMLDIDHFKQVNDNFGHATGDLALQHVAGTCKKDLREIDIIGRIGGEEFAVFMPETGLQGAVIAAEKIRRKIESIQMLSLETSKPVHLSASFGVTALKKEDTLSTLMAKTDKLLYKAKKSGRNRICSPDNQTSKEKNYE
ncbi:MAG: hypothetical protein CSB24_03320 [Deltaproteobacteria bacterium]|nr:MAG: hypothetical protein CSB24_03320 [Deltaproteobacteria bacterium]